MLGIIVAPLTAELARQLSSPEGTTGVAVIDVDPYSTADAKGLREGDIIVEVNQRPVKDVSEVMKAMNESAKEGAPAGVILLKILRNGTDYGHKFRGSPVWEIRSTRGGRLKAPSKTPPDPLSPPRSA